MTSFSCNHLHILKEVTFKNFDWPPTTTTGKNISPNIKSSQQLLVCVIIFWEQWGLFSLAGNIFLWLYFQQVHSYIYNNYILSVWFLWLLFKVLLRRKFLFLFPSFFNINLLYMFKIIQITKNWNDTCVRGQEISHWKVRKYRPPLQSSQNNSPRDLRKAVVRLTTWFMHCDVETSTKRFAFGKSL